MVFLIKINILLFLFSKITNIYIVIDAVVKMVSHFSSVKLIYEGLKAYYFKERCITLKQQYNCDMPDLKMSSRLYLFLALKQTTVPVPHQFLKEQQSSDLQGN